MERRPTPSRTGKFRASAGLVQMSAASGVASRRPRTILRRIVGLIGRRDEWRYVKQHGPTVLPFTTSLVRYLTDTVPTLSAEQPLLAHCVSRGIDGWLQAQAGADQEQQRFLAFVRHALLPLPDALEWTLSRCGGNDVEVWNPLEQCVLDWWIGEGCAPEARRRNRPEDSAYVALNPADYRLIVLVRFLARDSISLTPLSARLDDLVARYG